MQTLDRRSVGVVGVVVGCCLAACGPVYQTQEELAREHFAVGKSWPEAATTIQQTFGDNVMYNASCRTDADSEFGFGRIGVNDYVISTDTGARPFQGVAAFREGLLNFFISTRCAAATVRIDEKIEVSLRVSGGRVTESSVRRR